MRNLVDAHMSWCCADEFLLVQHFVVLKRI